MKLKSFTKEETLYLEPELLRFYFSHKFSASNYTFILHTFVSYNLFSFPIENNRNRNSEST